MKSFHHLVTRSKLHLFCLLINFAKNHAEKFAGLTFRLSFLNVETLIDNFDLAGHVLQ